MAAHSSSCGEFDWLGLVAGLAKAVVMVTLDLFVGRSYQRRRR
jgi:hypothetical protein